MTKGEWNNAFFLLSRRKHRANTRNIVRFMLCMFEKSVAQFYTVPSQPVCTYLSILIFVGRYMDIQKAHVPLAILCVGGAGGCACVRAVLPASLCLCVCASACLRTCVCVLGGLKHARICHASHPKVLYLAKASAATGGTMHKRLTGPSLFISALYFLRWWARGAGGRRSGTAGMAPAQVVLKVV